MSALFDIDPSCYRGAVLDRGVTWAEASLRDVNALLRTTHYLGPIQAGRLLLGGYDDRGDLVAAQVWRQPTARAIPNDGSWLELSRWCLTPAAGLYAGSRQHRYAVRTIRETFPQVTTLLSYSDPAVGHTGALYRACNWRWAPTWMRLRPPPTGGGTWDGVTAQVPKDRWVFEVRRDEARDDALLIRDASAIRYWLSRASSVEMKWAAASPARDLVEAVEASRSVTFTLEAGAA